MTCHNSFSRACLFVIVCITFACTQLVDSQILISGLTRAKANERGREINSVTFIYSIDFSLSLFCLHSIEMCIKHFSAMCACLCLESEGREGEADKHGISFPIKGRRVLSRCLINLFSLICLILVLYLLLLQKK
jgi:hypothetical protein